MVRSPGPCVVMMLGIDGVPQVPPPRYGTVYSRLCWGLVWVDDFSSRRLTYRSCPSRRVSALAQGSAPGNCSVFTHT